MSKHEKQRAPVDAVTAAARLEGLCHPLAEAMSDKDRVDAFVAAGLDAAATLRRLHTKLDDTCNSLAEFLQADFEAAMEQEERDESPDA